MRNFEDYAFIEANKNKPWKRDSHWVNKGKSVLLAVKANPRGTPRQRMKWKAQQLAELYTVSVEEVLGEGRRKLAMKAKVRFYIWLREKKKFSYPQIGRLVGRDHTSVMHLIGQARRYGVKRFWEEGAEDDKILD